MININCIYSDNGIWCKCKKVKRSLFGLGARCCIEVRSNDKCEFKVPHRKPNSPPPQGKRNE